MKKWGIGFIIVLLFCIPIFANRGTGQGLLQDTDTKVLLQTVRERHAPLSWFAGDWPLQNHFYRPLPTLAFELDNYLYKDNAAGYGTTNALLAIGCVFLLFWFLREFTNNPIVSAAASSLFACWVSGNWAGTFASLVQYAGYLGLLLAIYLLFKKPIPWAKVRVALAAFLSLYYAAAEVAGGLPSPIGEMQFRMLGWLPGRTASVMTVFALFAMAAYARYERTSAKPLADRGSRIADGSGALLSKAARKPTPLDPPATKGTTQLVQAKAPWLWGVLACVGTVLAFCSYEQAVMLPAALLGVAIAMRWQGFKSRWAWQIPFWLCLFGYLLLRKELLPAGTSGYQQQQLRFGPGVYLSLEAYAIPFWGTLLLVLQNLGAGLAPLFFPDFYFSVLFITANVVAFVETRRRFVFAFSGWALSFLTFLPMAWLKHFEHYDFWPMALRSLFAVTLCWIGFDLVVSAASPQAEQAPARLDPAPGSLPRP